jgi:hypothetical protein
MSRCDAEEFRRTGGPTAVPFRICCVALLLRARDPGASVICTGIPLADAAARTEPVIAGAPERSS